MHLLKPFDPWRSQLCTCPPKYSLSAYTGCGNKCLYCYASSYIPRFYAPRPKKNFILRLAKEINKIPKGSLVAISNSSDPYQALEKKLRLTRRTLELLKGSGLKINLITKSDLILEDIDLLKKIKKVLISITITTLCDKLSRELEPGCPVSSQRLKAAKKLAEFFPVVIRLDPLIYPLNTKNLKKSIEEIKKTGAAQIITSTYKVKPDNFKRMGKAFSQHIKLWEKLYYQKGERHLSYVYLEKNRRKELIKKIGLFSLEAGLRFTSCREGLEEFNNSCCDGTNLISKKISYSTKSESRLGKDKPL